MTMARTRPPSRLPALVALVSGWVLLALVVGHAPVPVRTAATFLVVGFCPGMAMRELVPARDFLERLVYTVALSLSVAVLVTLGLALVHSLTLEFDAAVFAAVTSALALVDLAVGGRLGHRRPPSAVAASAPHAASGSPHRS